MAKCAFRYFFIIFALGFVGPIDGILARNFARQKKTHEPYQNIINEKEVLETIETISNVGHVITDCMFVTSETGYFTYVHNSSTKDVVCGIYFMAEADKRIEVVFMDFDVPCEDDGLVAFVDGWELNGQYFPSPSEHQLPLEKRVSEFCGPKLNYFFISSQNAALIQYRVTRFSKGFTIFVKHLRNPRPCNIVADSATDDVSFTLRNYGRRINCTLMAIYPVAVGITAMNIANSGSHKESGIMRKCNILNKDDYVLIGGTHGIDTTDLDTFQTICSARRDERVIGCHVSAIKLISSGYYDNYVNVRIRKMNENDILDDAIFCDLHE